VAVAVVEVVVVVVVMVLVVVVEVIVAVVVVVVMVVVVVVVVVVEVVVMVVVVVVVVMVAVVVVVVGFRLSTYFISVTTQLILTEHVKPNRVGSIQFSSYLSSTIPIFHEYQIEFYKYSRRIKDWNVI
jgi:hypothetical protein